MSLTELTNKLAKEFDECLETILALPEQQQQQQNKEGQEKGLRYTFLQLESQLKNMKTKALQDKELSLKEMNRLLKRDIEIKKRAIETYVTKLDEWDKEIPILIEQSNRAMASRLNGYDFDSDIATPPAQTTNDVQQQNDDDDDDDDEDVEFEEV
ncbi:hypothetical protein G6F70_001012 [Rhizopus microsporus]|nr:hypothetical protein G6F71_008994 [Rhizopus microsporus]KAG1203848.1 hypothetical protein G6F70_001012 [Rhizopus microsporus]KAG1206179.1 hypothetical protein G6F69_009017 [Rhizopus microsporus]KAG1234703.1 hypothetical protein G6F67_003338 [Rhizopus microsporus]KAG1266122.1 hypothetical protein G6F68_003026 [Rhizopus microsporus]